MRVNYITIHCSATKPKRRTTIEDIDKWHRDRGFRKVGYHWYIDRDGDIHQGRNETEIGAHVAGHNLGNVGICLEGGLSDETGDPENNYTVAQWDALTLLLKEVIGRHGVKWGNIKGHRDWGANKACPCFDVNDYLDGEWFR
ncbi:amidase [Vibrio phage 159E36-2a]